jgi:hypothetical protein
VLSSMYRRVAYVGLVYAFMTIVINLYR